MKTTLKRLFSLLMVLVMVGSMLPAVYADSSAEPVDDVIVLTDEDYAAADDVFAQIDDMENAPAKKNASETQLADAAAEIVMASENYVEGSLERNGNFFTWWTDEGIRCVYSPRMRDIQDNMVAPEDPIADGAYNEPVATKGGWPSGNQVYLIGPYYGSDSSFTDQYKNEAKAIASAIGDTDGYTLYSGTKATVDKVAEAVSNGAVVIFDSHGTTDYESGNDYVTGANNSYLCLETSTGMTNADYLDGALYGSGYAYINGATIANHMTKQSPAGIVWMAICLGMATDTLCEPMRDMGVEVVYGYSQSVTFEGDYRFETTFWDNMIAGKDVAASVAAMKSRWGNWDWSTQIANDYGSYDGYSTISAARSDYAAFPIVVSDEDTHPGQRSGSSNYGADSLQTVKSTYTLFSQYAVSVQVNNSDYGSATANGSTITAVPAAGYFAESATVVSGTATVTQNGNTFSVAAESDCTVQINFAPKTAVTVNFSGASVSGQTGYAGDSMTLPTANAPEGYTFLGWTTAPLSSETTEKPSYYTDSFIPTANTTLYALYSFVDSTSGGGSGDYVKVTESRNDWSGEYVIVYEADGYILDGSRTTLDATSNYKAVTITNNTIAAADADPYKFVIAPMDGGYSIKSASNKYIGGQSGSNKLVEGSTELLNTIALDADGNATIISNASYLRYNATSGQYRFRYYKSTTYSSQKAIALYIKDGSAGTTYYVSTLCEHPSTSPVAAVAATCTEAGYTAGTQCNDCGSYVTGHQVVAALGHDWSDWAETTAPSCETAGEEARTCGNCGETQTQAVAATGHSFGDWVVTTEPTCTAEGEKTRTCSACGATEKEVVSVIDHNYGEGTETTAATCDTAGVMTYTCSACGNITTEAIPALGHNYSAGVCTVCGEAEPENTSARFYIAANRSDTYFYMTSDLGTASRSRYQAVDSGLSVLPESITEPEDGYVFILTDNGDGTYSLQAEGETDYSYLGWTTGNSGLLVDADSALALTVDVTDGVYSIHFAASDAERYLSLNATAGNDYFAWYKSGQLSDLFLIPVTDGTATEPTEPEATEPEVTEPAGSVALDDGDQVVIFAPAYNKALSSAYTSFYNQGVDISVANGVVTGYGDTEIWTVIKNADGTYSFAYGGQNLGMEDSYTSTPLGGVNDDWNIIPLGNGLYNIQNTVRGNYIEWYADKDNWSSYNSTSAATDDQYQLSFYIIGEGILGDETEEPEETEPEVTEPEVTEPEVTEPEVTEPEVTEPEVTEPEATAPAGSVTTLQYVFGEYPAGLAGATGEVHELDDVVTMTVNNGYLTSMLRLYANGGNAIFASTKVIDSIVVQAGYKASTLTVYGSTDGETWTVIEVITTTSTQTEYTVAMPDGSAYTYLMLEAGTAQVRIPQMTINVVEPGAAVINQVNGMAMLLGSDLNVIFNVTMADDSQLVITVADQTYTFNANQLSATDDGSYDAYVPIAAAQMADEIVVKFVTGENESESSVYTVKAYADYILTDVNNEFTDEDKALVQAMLNYGGAAQTYFGYNTENLVSTEFGEAVPESAQEMVVTDTSNDITFYGASLVYRERIAVRFYFTGDVAGKLFTVQGKEVEAVQKDNLYYVEITDILPQNLDQQITLTLGDTLSVTYGPMNYIVRMYEKGSESLQNLMQALYNYHLSAKAFVEA